MFLLCKGILHTFDPSFSISEIMFLYQLLLEFYTDLYRKELAYELKGGDTTDLTKIDGVIKC